MSRNAKIILIVVLLVVIAALILFLLVRRGGEDGGAGGFLGGIFGGGTLPPTGGPGGVTPGTGDIPQGGTLPVTDTEKSKLTLISKDPATGAAIGREGGHIMYFKLGQGHLYTSAFDGDGGEQLVSNFTITDILGASWSHDSSYALIKSLSKYQWVRLTGTSTIEYGDVPGQIMSIDFSPEENRIALVTQVGASTFVRTSSPDGTNVKSVSSIPVGDVDLYWHEAGAIALKTKTSGLAPSILQSVTLAGRSSVLDAGKYGFDLIWNAGGSRRLVMETTEAGKNPKLTLHNTAASTVSSLTFKTLPEKCLFSALDADILYCAIPSTKIDDLVLPDSWWQGRVQFSDTLWKINLGTGENTLLLEGGGFDITELLVSPNENYIFFVNKKDSALWSLKLL